MKKKLIMLILAFVFIPVVALADDTYYENYFGIKMTEEEYNNLLQLGFSEKEIYHMGKNDFDRNKDVKAELVSDITNYYVNIKRYDATGRVVSDVDMQIPKEDYEKYASGEVASPLDALAEVGTEYKLMRTTIARNGVYFRYKVTLEWQKMPKVRSYDIIGIGYDRYVCKHGDLHYNTVYCDSASCKVSYDYHHSAVNPNGAGVSFSMPTSTKVTEIDSTLYFDIEKVNDNNVVTALLAYGDYAHAVKTVTPGQARSFYINQGGVDLLDEAYDYYDDIPSADAEWYGTW